MSVWCCVFGQVSIWQKSFRLVSVRSCVRRPYSTHSHWESHTVVTVIGSHIQYSQSLRVSYSTYSRWESHAVVTVIINTVTVFIQKMLPTVIK